MNMSRRAAIGLAEAGNGRVIAVADEGYKTRAACLKILELIMAEAASAPIEDLS
jgi:uncharacterized protein YegP (UPF0339 family)